MKMWNIDIREYYSAIKIEILFGTTWMDLEGVLRAVSQIEKKTMISLTCGL